MMNSLKPRFSTCVTLAGVALLSFVCSGCSKGKREPPITGKASDPAVSLRCMWKPGFRYHVKLEMEELSDSAAAPDPNEMGMHRVTLVQDCMITATNVRKGDNVGIDMEILSLAMERMKGAAVSLSFDSEQGGEASDDFGYIPALQALVGGHLQFVVSPDGKMVRASGIPEWLARGLNEAGPRPPPRAATKRSRSTNAPPVDNTAPATNGIIQNVLNALTGNNAPAGPNPGKVRSTVANALRNLFTSEHFRQMIEFDFLPSTPVRVGEEWKSQGDTLIGRNRFRFQATGKFRGWQQHLGTNCARVDVRGQLFGPGPPARTNAPPQKDGLHATLWIDTQLNFPITTAVNAEAPGSAAAKPQGTNAVVRSPPKSLQQSMTITLLEVTPIAGASDATTEPPSKP